jgi:hypothetical protein
MPGGDETTEPLPAPPAETVRSKTAVNAAVTDCAAFMVTVQGVAWPVHAPLQPANTEPDADIAASDTTVPTA